MAHTLSSIPNPHDRLFRQSLGLEPVARDFFQVHLPARVLSQVNLSILRPCPRTFLDEQLDQQESDVLYLTQLKQEGRPCYLYLLVEHQSSVDRWLPLRLVSYQVAILKSHRQQYPKESLPAVFPMVYYQEEHPYKESLDFFTLFSHPTLAREAFAALAHLIDLCQLPDSVIQEHRSAALFEFVQKHIRDQDFLQLLEGLVLVLKKLQKSNLPEEMLGAYEEAAFSYLLRASAINFSAFIDSMEKTPLRKEVEIMLTVAEQLIQEGHLRGKLEGTREGILKGTQQGRLKGKQEVAENLLRKGLSHSEVAILTGLSKRATLCPA